MEIDLKTTTTDELSDLRWEARMNKDYILSDAIRNELESRGVFLVDKRYKYQIVYHMGIHWIGKRKAFYRTLRKINKRFLDQSANRSLRYDS